MTGLLYLVEFVFISTTKKKKRDTQIAKMLKFIFISSFCVPTAQLLPRRFAVWHFERCTFL
jgi:hypothetical protein